MATRRNATHTGRTRLTMADLARLAGVSTITVSRALADSPLVKPATRARIQALAREHGYELNVSARNLRLRLNRRPQPHHGHVVAVIVEMAPSAQRTMTDPYPLALLGGISQELTSAGDNVLLTTRESAVDAAVRSADGLILLGQGAHEAAVQVYDKIGLPMVVWGAPEPGGGLHVTVGSDNHRGGMCVAERFVSIGRRHPVFIGDPAHPEMAHRLDGFADALARHHIKPQLIRRTDFSLEAGVQAVRSLHRRKIPFDAIFACSDVVAMGATRALNALGQSVPDDVSVIGWDDNPQAAAFVPPLSTVRQNWLEGGVLLARKVLALIRGETVHSEMLPTLLVIRAT